MSDYDIAVIGAGIAGASAAAELAPHARVVMLEGEDTPGYHTTGRSAAFWHETLGGPHVQPLTTASRAVLRDLGVLRPRFNLNLAERAQVGLLDDLERSFEGTGVALRRIDHDGIKALVPQAEAILVGGVIEEDCADIDVAALHQHYLSRFRQGGGTLETRFRVKTIERSVGDWIVSDGNRAITASTIVNAAGAWADTIAVQAGAKPLGIQPMRRTIVQVRVAGGEIPENMPFCIDIGGTYYFRAEGRDRLWLCPHDETPVDPHDAAAEDLDVAIAIDRFETVTAWRVAAVERKWAGLRSFAPDRLPVYGFDAGASGFFWCAGQGGVGIQTSPAAGKLCAHLILGSERDRLVEGIDAVRYSPERFRAA